MENLDPASAQPFWQAPPVGRDKYDKAEDQAEGEEREKTLVIIERRLVLSMLNR
jgi:hypothetical protein